MRGLHVLAEGCLTTAATSQSVRRLALVLSRVREWRRARNTFPAAAPWPPDSSCVVVVVRDYAFLALAHITPRPPPPSSPFHSSRSENRAVSVIFRWCSRVDLPTRLPSSAKCITQ